MVSYCGAVLYKSQIRSAIVQMSPHSGGITSNNSSAEINNHLIEHEFHSDLPRHTVN